MYHTYVNVQNHFEDLLLYVPTVYDTQNVNHYGRVLFSSDSWQHNCMTQ